MSSESTSYCPSCGQRLSPGEQCPACSRRTASIFRLIHRELVLLGVLAVIAGLVYWGTQAFARSMARTKVATGAAWFRQGQKDLHEGRPDAAVASFRRASVNDRSKTLYTESLAAALIASGHKTEARQILLQLREGSPENPQVNVELARLSAQQGEVPEALRYYHNALYGIWTGDKIDQRQTQVRAELINFLIAQHARDQALAEILALAYHLPNDVPSHLELGDMFARVNDPQRARTEFLWVLRHDPRSQTALQGAAQAAFQMRDYAQAKRLLEQVEHRTQPQQELLNSVMLITSNDPFQRHLDYAERARRLKAAFKQANTALNVCRTQTTADKGPLDALAQKFAGLSSSVTEAKLRLSPDLAFPVLELIEEAETEIGKACGPLSPLDQALLLIAQKDRGEQ